MQNKWTRFLTIALLASLALGALTLPALLGGSASRLGTPPVALAASPANGVASSQVFLPFVMRNYPLRTVFGVEMNSISTGGGLSQIAQANTTWVRRHSVEWQDVEPVRTDPPTYDWSALSGLESELRNAAANHMKVILIVRGTPAWAQKPGQNSFCGPIAQDQLPAFGQFMRQLVARYSVGPYYVKYWELGNEPDVDPALVPSDSVFGCWGNEKDTYYGGGYYGEMLKVVYPQIKAADSASQVLVGGLLLDCNPDLLGTCGNPKPPRFLEGILLDGAAPYFDGISFHAYDSYLGALGQYDNLKWQSGWNTTGPVVIAKAQFLQGVLAKYGVTGKYLMNTEAAVLCGGSNDPPGEPGCESTPSSNYEQTKAYYLAQVYAASMALDLRANVWYSVFGWRNSALLNTDLTPRPAFTAFEFARKEMLIATYAGTITSADLGGASGVTGYKFSRSDKNVWILWSQDGATHNLNLAPGAPAAIWDVYGVAQTVSGSSLSVDLSPVYVEWNP